MNNVGVSYIFPLSTTFIHIQKAYKMGVFQNLPAFAASSTETASGDFTGFFAIICTNNVQVN